MYHHRASSLKQQNKAHKTGGHATHRSLDRAAHGRLEGAAAHGHAAAKAAKGTGLSRENVKSLAGRLASAKAARANTNRQLAEARRMQAMVAKRLGAGAGVPRVVAVIALNEYANPASVVAQMLSLADSAWIPESWHDADASILANFDSQHQRLQICAPPRAGQMIAPAQAGLGDGAHPYIADVTHSLAAVRNADVVVLVTSVAGALDVDRHGAAAERASAGGTTVANRLTDTLVDAAGEVFLATLKSIGVPTVIGVVQGLEALSGKVSVKGLSDARRTAARFFESEFGAEMRVLECPDVLRSGISTDDMAGVPSSSQLVRTLCGAALRQVPWRQQRSHLVSQHASFHPSDAAAPESGELCVFGYLRGRPLNVNQLVCIAGGGVYQIDSVTSVRDPTRGGSRVAEPMGSASSALIAARDAAVRIAEAAAVPVGLHEHASNTEAFFVPLPVALFAFAAKFRVARTEHFVAGVESSPLAVAEESLREDLHVLNNADGLEGEQTWPTQDELARAAEEDMGSQASSGKRRPRGMSSYMAAWLPSDDDTDDYTSAEEGDDQEIALTEEERERRRARKASEALQSKEERDKLKARRRRKGIAAGAAALPAGYKPSGADDSDAASEDGGDMFDADRAAPSSTTAPGGKLRPQGAPVVGVDGRALDGDADGDEEMSVEDDNGPQDLAVVAEELLARKRSAAADEVLFPDEVDTPMTELASDRFARYRGLKSFRTSPWNAKENLPPSYARISDLGRFKRVEHRILAQAELAERALCTLESRAAAEDQAEKKGRRAASMGRKLAERHGASTAGTRSAGDSVGFDDEAMDSEDGSDLEPSVTDDTMDVDETSGKKGRQFRSKRRQALEAAREAQRAASRAGHERHAGKASATGETAMEADAAEYKKLQDILGPGWLNPGQFVCVKLRGVSLSAIRDARVPGSPMALAALFQHENRATVAHFKLTRVDTYTEPIKGKEHLEFHVGPRVFDARPIFSQQSHGLDRNRMERFMQLGRVTTATVFAPITYGALPVLVYRRLPVDVSDKEAAVSETAAAVSPALYPAPDRLNGPLAGTAYRLQLVATGSVIGAEPDRLILKRSILSGYPVKVKRRRAVVKYMFFNPDDVNYFKPVELRTKHGLVGEILESLGTHGLMKCQFDRPIKQHDTVCMALYKRVFPRWGECYKAIGAADLGDDHKQWFARGHAGDDDAEIDDV